jgi:hypothetical protein
MSIQGLQKLEVWRRSKDFALRIYSEVLSSLPPEEKWNLNSQIRRSALSISANISDAKYISETLYKELSEEGDEIDRMLNGYIAYLKRSKQGNTEPGADRTIRDLQEPYLVDASDEPSVN